MPRTALVAGATGLIGSLLLPRLLADPAYSRVKALSRRSLNLQDAKLEVLLSDLRDPASLGGALMADEVFCCLGTTIKTAGSRAAFEAVDYQMVVDLARAAKDRGAKKFMVISAAGTAANSPSFYSRVKARMEADVSALGYDTVHILRPSLLMGPRAERRPGERAAQVLAPLFNPLLIGPWKKYRAIEAEEVAQAMLSLAQRDVRGVHIHHLPLESRA